MRTLLLIFCVGLFSACQSSQNSEFAVDSTTAGPKAPIENVAKVETTAPEPKPEKPTVKLKSLSSLMADEPKVKDYVYTPANVLYVVVHDDGTNRSGLASYFCQIAKESEEAQGCQKVKIVEYGTMNTPQADNAYGRLLGEYICW